jgi:hypothetical protein
MAVTQFTHEGVTYNFEPPIETGGRIAGNLAELVAIAKEGPDITDRKLDVARISAHLVLRHSESDRLSTINSLLNGKHEATVE